MLVGLLAILKPGSPLIAAGGMASIAAAGLVRRDHSVSGIHADQWIALAVGLFVCGATLVGLSVASRNEKSSAAERRLTTGLAVCALLACFLVTLFGLDAINLHRGAREWPSAAVWSLGLAGALAFAHRPRFRYAAVPAACVGLAAMFLGSATFLDRFVDDPFLAPAEPITVGTFDVSPVATFTVPFDAGQLWLSPTGRYMALSSEDEQERMTIHAGRAGGSLTAFEADEAMFVDEGRLLLLERQRTGTVLRVVDVGDGSREIWSRSVALWAGSVSVDRSSDAWRLLGWNDAGDIASVTGRIGEDATSEEHWKSSGMEIDQLQPVAVSNGNMLAVETRSASSRFARALGPWAPLIRPATRTESRVWTVGPQPGSGPRSPH